MSSQCVINVDLAAVYDKPSGPKRKFLTMLAWGDYVEVLEVTDEYVAVKTVVFKEQLDGSILYEDAKGYIAPSPKAKKADGTKLTPTDVVIPRENNQVLKVNFVDVQQGDGIVIESPDGKTILVDGGDNQLFARYLADRYRGTSRAKPKEIDCLLVTHGDADHFTGLVEILKSERNKEAKKKLFIAPKRVFHNGLVKRPEKVNGTKLSAEEQLGSVQKVAGDTIITGLVENLLDVPDEEMNKNFLAWKKALAAWNKRGEIEFRRLSFGDDKAFKFFNDKKRGLEISVLGPILAKRRGTTGLAFLHEPPPGPRLGHDSLNTSEPESKSLSVSHTINGHSIVFRLSYGGINYLFTGDLNDEAGRALVRKSESQAINLRSEVLKVPHHGSADFSSAFLDRVSPIVSVISCGDESSRKEYVHPRATLLGALGKRSRLDESLIFVTELVAFFRAEKMAKLSDPKKAKQRGEFFAFSRAAFGIVKTRTDGKRLLVYTDSGKADLKEAYCYATDENGEQVPTSIIKA